MVARPDLIIDGDGHVVEVNETYEGIDPAYRDRRPIYTEASKGNIVRLVDGRVWTPEGENGFVGVNGNQFPPVGKAYLYRRMGTYNAWARLSDMDEDNIDVAVVYTDRRVAAKRDQGCRFRRCPSPGLQRLAI